MSNLTFYSKTFDCKFVTKLLLLIFKYMEEDPK